MSGKNRLVITTPSDREIVLTRIFDAPRALVFETLTKCEHVTQWWGPNGTEMVICEMDFRVGGSWLHTMRMANGSEMTMRGIYREIIAPERIVSTECYVEPSRGNPEWLATITLEEHGGKTTFTNRLLHPSKANRDGHLNSGMETGASQTFDRLGELLEKMENPMEREIEITRVFDAPRDLVYAAWTDPNAMEKWFGPEVFTNHDCRLDVRPGGEWQITMRSPQGSEHPCRGVYREVIPQEKLVFTNNAFDTEGKQLLEGFTTVTFTEAKGKTVMKLTTRAKGFVDYAPQMLKGMYLGWNQSFDKLVKQLKA